MQLRTIVKGALPLANRNRTRLFAEGGVGLGFERYEARQAQGLSPAGTLVLPELRLGAGLWHRLSRPLSLFVAYRLRVHIAGAGVDSISELVELGSSRSTLATHLLEAGAALHF